MERADLFRVFELGAAVQPAGQLREGATLAQVFTATVQASSELDIFLGDDPQIKADLSLAAAREARAAIANIENFHFKDASTGAFHYPQNANATVIEPWFVWRLTKAIQNFESVLRAELQVAATYWVPKRGSYSTRDLVDAFDRAFLADLRPTVGEAALGEYRNAGRCFAFGLWTAAGYHSCRAVEAVLRPYYRAFSGKDDNDWQTWHNLIEGLETVAAEPKPVDKTLFYLRQLKNNERNPLMHVRVSLDEQDADLLLSSAKVVIVHMAREMISLENEKAATPLLQVVSDKAGLT